MLCAPIAGIRADALAPALSCRLAEAKPATLRSLQVHRAGLAALVVLQVVGDPLVLLERGHPGGLDRGHVDEGVVAAGLVGDEAIALAVVEKFYCADWHV